MQIQDLSHSQEREMLWILKHQFAKPRILNHPSLRFLCSNCSQVYPNVKLHVKVDNSPHARRRSVRKDIVLSFTSCHQQLQRLSLRRLKPVRISLSRKTFHKTYQQPASLSFFAQPFPSHAASHFQTCCCSSSKIATGVSTPSSFTLTK